MANPVQVMEALGRLEIIAIHVKQLGHEDEALQLQQIVSELTDEAIEKNYHEIVAFLEDAEVVLEDGTAVKTAADLKQKFRRLKKRHKPKKWLCCSKPVKIRTRKGKNAFKSICKYKMGQRTGVMPRIIISKRPPKAMMMGGKRMPICK